MFFRVGIEKRVRPPKANIGIFDKYLDNLKKEAKLENNFANLGINIHKDYSKIISGVNILRLSNNPVELKAIDLKKIIQE